MKKKVLKESLQIYLSDNTQSWQLQSDGSYKQNTPGNAAPKSAQSTLLELYSS